MKEEEIHHLCKKYNIQNYTINNDMSVDVEDNVNLNDDKLTEIPFNFNKVNGYFDCSFNNLKTLKGCPKKVNSDFDCSHNDLIDLNYCPSMIEGSMDCSNNKIQSLKESPETLVSFHCDNNKLKDLYGSPKIIKHTFNCTFNKIKSFTGGPERVGVNYSCSDNNIRSFDGFPKIELDSKIKHIIILSNPIVEIWNLFQNIEMIDYFNDLDIIQDNGNTIILDRLNYFLNDIGKNEIISNDIRNYKVIVD